MKTSVNTKTNMIKGAALTAFATLLILAITASANTPKVVICHIQHNNQDNAHELVVPAAAVNAHLSHGDHLGVCNPEPPMEEGYVGIAL